jgi:multisubunit Na+/H+ antiporter MnhB subunit
MMQERSVILDQATPLLYRLMIIASVWLWLRGHNAPGGGFVGALMALSATAAYSLVFGTERARQQLPLAPARLSAVGVLLAAASGVPALLRGEPFLTHAWTKVWIGSASLPVSTVMLFDLGVLLAVWGALAGFALALLEEES